MLETTIIIIATYAFIGTLAAILCVYRYYLGNRLVNSANKLKSQMATIKQYYPELAKESGSIVAKGLGDIGIEGILSELGIDSKIVQNPIVKGLIDRYAPKILEQLAKKQESGSSNGFPQQSFM